MRPSFPELMYGLFYLAMSVVIIAVGVKGCTVLDGIEQRQQQSTLHHEKLIAMADKALADHDRMLQRLFPQPSGR